MFRMFDTVNVTVGAILGIVLADSPAFKLNNPKNGVAQLLIFVVLIVLITVNIYAATDSLGRWMSAAPRSDKRKTYCHYFIFAVVMFLIIQSLIISSSIVMYITGQYKSSDFIVYIWFFVIVTTIWFIFGNAAALYEKDS